MNIIIISTMASAPWGGSEELWYEAALYAHSLNYKISVLISENDIVHDKINKLQSKGIDLYFIEREKKIHIPIWKRVLRRIIKSKIVQNKYSFIGGLRADYILLSQGGTLDIIYNNDLIGVLKNIRIPYAILNHHHHEFGFISMEHNLILKEVFQNAFKLFFVAKRNKEVLQRQLAINFISAEIIKNPVNLLKDTVITWPKNPVPNFAVVARLDINFKGQDILLETFTKEKWRQRDFKLSLFGSGPSDEYLNNLIIYYGLADKVFLKGHINNIEDVWMQHHVLILPSLSEGTPLSLVEALLCGRPCLVTDVGDSASLLKDNETGWIAYAASVCALDEALERAWEQRNDWQNMGLVAHENAKLFIDANPGKTLIRKLDLLK